MQGVMLIGVFFDVLVDLFVASLTAFVTIECDVGVLF
jgi:hypothetical protein